MRCGAYFARLDQVSAVQPGQVRGIRDRRPDPVNSLPDELDQEIPVPGQIGTQGRQPFITLAGKSYLRRQPAQSC